MITNTAFGRSYSLVVGNPKEIRDTINERDDIKLTIDFTTEVIDSIKITNSRIKASIVAGKETSKPNAGGSTIELYNLSDDELSWLVKDNSVLLKAGYESVYGTNPDNMPLIYAGQIQKVQTIRDNGDFITKIICGDSVFARNNIRVSGIILRDQTYFDAIKTLTDILKTKGVPVQDIDIYKEQADRLFSLLPNGFSYEGNLVDQLAKLVASINYRIYFHLGKMYLEPVEEPFYLDSVLIGPNNVKGTVKPSSSSVSKSSKDKDSKEGISFSTFLNGEITLNKALVINEIEKFTGNYKIISLIHALDTEGQEWDTRVVSRRI